MALITEFAEECSINLLPSGDAVTWSYMYVKLKVALSTTAFRNYLKAKVEQWSCMPCSL